MQRFFRTSDADLYESMRVQLDAAWGHPSEDGQTTTCFDPADLAPRDSEGRILLAVHADFVTWEPAASMLPGLIQQGYVEEITEDQYQAALAQVEP